MSYIIIFFLTVYLISLREPVRILKITFLISHDTVLSLQLLLLFSPSVMSDSLRHQMPLSMGFPRQEYWSGLPLPSPGDVPDRGMEPASPALAGGFFTTEPPGNWINALVKETLESSLQRKNSHL